MSDSPWIKLSEEHYTLYRPQGQPGFWLDVRFDCSIMGWVASIRTPSGSLYTFESTSLEEAQRNLVKALDIMVCLRIAQVEKGCF